jgi:hypothetical protein
MSGLADVRQEGQAANDDRPEKRDDDSNRGRHDESCGVDFQDQAQQCLERDVDVSESNRVHMWFEVKDEDGEQVVSAMCAYAEVWP